MKNDIKRATEAIRSADALLIGAGAGMGVDSGLPDFRGTQGFWRAYPAIAKLGISFEEMANPAWFRNNPKLAWAFYGHRLNLYRRTMPHAGFARLLEIGNSKPQGYFVFTSNVDGHFQKAGFAPDRIVECHGSIHHLQCTRPCCDEIWGAEGERVTVDEEKFEAQEPLPKCRKCGALARPNILMFGDGRWLGDRSEQQEHLLEQWLNELAADAKLVIVELGAGTSIPSVRYTCERLARRVEGTMIRINPRESEVPDVHIGLPMGALEGINSLSG